MTLNIHNGSKNVKHDCPFSSHLGQGDLAGDGLVVDSTKQRLVVSNTEHMALSVAVVLLSFVH